MISPSTRRLFDDKPPSRKLANTGSEFGHRPVCDLGQHGVHSWAMPSAFVGSTVCALRHRNDLKAFVLNLLPPIPKSKTDRSKTSATATPVADAPFEEMDLGRGEEMRKAIAAF